NNSTTSEQEEAQLNTKNLNNLSYVWNHFMVLEDKVHAQCQICDRKGKNIKYVFHSTISNMIYHLENKHRIMKKNPIDENIENFFEVAHGKAAHKKQPIIEIAMLTWMIDDCQPLYLLRSPKNTENLRNAQCKLNYQKVYEVLLDVCTYWNSMEQINLTKFGLLYYALSKKTVAPPNDQDEDYYTELLYGELDVTASQSSSTNVHSDDEIVDLAGRVDQALSISHGHVQKHKNTLVNSQQNSDLWFKKRQAIELLVTITNMLE
ncbi:19373_t:CDS:2, partial [Gigaspora margarita]